MKRTLLTIPLLGLFAAGCYYDNREEMYPSPSSGGNSCDTTAISYQSDIQPIFSANCATSGCHDVLTQGGGYVLANYAGAKAVPSDRLMGSIKHLPDFSPMPKGTTQLLDDCSINKIQRWANLGQPQ